MADVSPEYISARRVLLDALTALEPQLKSFVLVGAQAVYEHTGDVEGLGIASTTDSDLVLDATLLTDDPELTQALIDQGFAPDAITHNPGSWVGSQGIKVDVMAVPHQSGRTSPKARAASLPPHDKKLARITGGLEPALVDHRPKLITALDASDSRSFTLKVAGPAALLSAKLIKLQEREMENKESRLKGKDVLDVFRLLTGTETEELVAGFNTHQDNQHAKATSDTALSYFNTQRTAGASAFMRGLLENQAVIGQGDLERYDQLCNEVLNALSDAGLLTS